MIKVWNQTSYLFSWSCEVMQIFSCPYLIDILFVWKQFECLVEGCGLKFKTYKARQRHLIDKHKFPTSFEFYKKGHPSKKQRQKNQRKPATHKKEVAPSAMEVENEAMDELVSAVSKLSTSDSPTSISFGHRHTRGLPFVPRAIQRGRT